MFIGGTGNAPNNGRMFITLKPREERAENADQVIARLRPQLDKVPGAKLFLQAAQDVRVGGRARAPSSNTRCKTPISSS